MINENESWTQKSLYDGLTVKVIEVTPCDVLCGSAAQTDGLTITGSWMGPATDH